MLGGEAMNPDYVGLLAAYGYIFGILILAEIIRAALDLPQEFTRKVVHISVGMWVVGTFLLFETLAFALVPPLSFIIINYISYKKQIFKAMEGTDTLGTVYFPISFALLLFLYWQRPEVAVAGLMPLTWGDGMAAVLGRKFGTHKYSFFDCTKTLEGSLAMFLFSLVSVFLALVYMGGLDFGAALLPSAAIAVLATVLEAISIKGIDNLTVPIASAVLLSFIM